MKNYYGPYVRHTAAGKWHSNHNCSEYPREERIESMVSSNPVNSVEMCQECLSLDKAFEKKVNIKIKRIKTTLNKRQQSNNMIINDQIRSEQINNDSNSQSSNNQQQG